MKKGDRWFKTLVWRGKISTVPCCPHNYAWAGITPCTGVYRCILCGKPKSVFDPYEYRWTARYMWE